MLAIGIDLGTTNSSIATIDEHGHPVVIANDLGERITPSVICFKEGQIIIGAEAKVLQTLGLYPVAVFFKRQMGDEQFVFYADGVDYSATQLATLLLKKIKFDAETILGQKVTDAVITVPAYFRDSERNATIAAGKAAGINVLQVINEPTAAAVAYGLKKHINANSNFNKQTQSILVYDLGGGTFDVTLLSLERALEKSESSQQQDVIRVKNSDGDHQLGGKDWDDRIIEYMAAAFEDEFGVDPLEDAQSMADLLIVAEEAKKRLTSVEQTQVSISHDGNKGRYEFDRATFTRITADLMERTMLMTMRVLEDLALSPADIDGVLLIGGSTRMPMVQQYLKAQLDKPILSGVNVDESVALGAAMVAAERLNAGAAAKPDKSGKPAKPAKPVLALGGQIKTIDVSNHSLGMIALNGDQSAYVNSIILPKNVELPRLEKRPFQHKTCHTRVNELEIYMTQGESEHPADVAYIGRYVVSDIPHQEGKPAVIDVSYHYDESGTVRVDAVERHSQQKLNVTVEALPLDVAERFAGVPEFKAEPQPHVTAYLAFDLSGSMQGQPMVEAKKAALSFLQNTDLSHCSIGIIAFSDTARTKLVATQNAAKITAAINGLSAGETGVSNDNNPFGELSKLMKNTNGQCFGIVLTDGVWSYQSRAVVEAKYCHSNQIDIIAIGFGSADKQFLDNIASSDEGSYFTSMTGLVDTFSTIAQVLTESAGQSQSGLQLAKP
ncbi:MAG: molecular chaperone DnaK [Phenylobacterium sp.]|jgi:molecular chaperone DnaK